MSDGGSGRVARTVQHRRCHRAPLPMLLRRRQRAAPAVRADPPRAALAGAAPRPAMQETAGLEWRRRAAPAVHHKTAGRTTPPNLPTATAATAATSAMTVTAPLACTAPAPSPPPPDPTSPHVTISHVMLQRQQRRRPAGPQAQAQVLHHRRPAAHLRRPYLQPAARVTAWGTQSHLDPAPARCTWRPSLPPQPPERCRLPARPCGSRCRQRHRPRGSTPLRTATGTATTAAAC